jgi:hypothetical protein
VLTDFCYIDNTRDIFDYIGIFSPLGIGVVAIIVAIVANHISSITIKKQEGQFNKQLKTQKEQFERQMKSQLEQWKFDAVVRSEIETIVEMKGLINETNSAIHWFMWKFLAPFEGFIHYFHNAEDEVYKRIVFVNNWNKLQNINNALNRNFIIFQKYNLASKIQFIQPVLALLSHLDNNDFNFTFDRNNTNNVEESSQMNPEKFYKLDDIDKIKFIFAKEANKRLSKLCIDNYQTIGDEQLLNNYSYIWHKVNEILNSIDTELNKVLFDYESLNIADTERFDIHEYYSGRLLA